MRLWPKPFRWPWQPPTDLEGAREAKDAAHRDRPKVEAVANRAERLSERNGFGAAITKASR